MPESAKVKPPIGHASWVDAAVNSFPNTNCEIPDHVSAANAEALARAELSDLRAELDGLDRLCARQSKLLTDAINVLRGKPDELHMHSHHDIAEHAAALREQVKQARNAALDEAAAIVRGWAASIKEPLVSATLSDLVAKLQALKGS